MDRRDYVRTAGSVGLVSALGSFGTLDATNVATETAATETADTSRTVGERIAEHRTGDLEVVVEGPDGTALEGATVHVTQQSHEFTWGTSVAADTLADGGEGDNYLEYIPELFNTAVLENHHKWAPWEDERWLADDATDWLLDRGLDVRGHVCIWGDRDSAAIPSDVEDAMDDGDAETIRERSLQHVEDIVTAYESDVGEWEVVNEAIHATEMIETVEGSDVDPLRAPILADWFRRAESARFETVSLGINDYGVLAGNHDGERSDYESQIQFLLDEGVDLGTIGLQCHFTRDGVLDIDEIVSVLDRYVALGPRIKITEFDMADDDWPEDDRRDFLDTFLRAIFSHPGVDGFLMWGFWDGEHWEDDAPLFYEDWSEKPAYNAYEGLVYDEWWTDETGTTDERGTYATAAFLGEHEVTAETDGASATTGVSVTDSGATASATLTVDGSETVDGGDSADSV